MSSATTTRDGRTYGQVVEQRLTPLLGPFTARMALKTFSASKLGRTPEQISRQDVPPLLDALRPMLNTLVGSARAGAVLEELRKELLVS
ncbi:MAG TPA: hypothetical protein VND93_09260 [Myxococcales bacterium]|nr:hypothetical protein [Myxococcales bacterium]